MSEWVKDVNKYLNDLKTLTRSDSIGNMIEMYSYIKKKYDDEYPIGELNKNDKEYLEYTWALFKIIFWEGEAVESLNSKLVGPFYYADEDNFNWITINLTPGENRYLKTRPYALFDMNDNKFYYINQSLKEFIYNESFFQDSVLQKENILKNITEFEADLLALHFRVAFYSSNKGIVGFNSNNLICFKLNYVDDKEIKVFCLIDFGISDPDYDSEIGENSGKMSDLISIFRLSNCIFKKLDTDE